SMATTYHAKFAVLDDVYVGFCCKSVYTGDLGQRAGSAVRPYAENLEPATPWRTPRIFDQTSEIADGALAERCVWWRPEA
ncbi:MAG: hypothetical protein ACOVP2_08380, partial [Armatimonadaceae bacterium]